MPTPRVEAAAEGVTAISKPFYREHEHPNEARFIRTLQTLDLQIIHDAAGAAEEALDRFAEQPRTNDDAAVAVWLQHEMDRLNDIKAYAIEELYRRPMSGDSFENERRIGYVAKWDLHDCGAGFLETVAKILKMKRRAEHAEHAAERAKRGLSTSDFTPEFDE